MSFISIGTATVDYIIPVSDKGKKETLTFEKGRKYEIQAPAMRAGGGALNAAVTFTRGGHETSLISEWGADAAGSFLEQRMRAEKIIPRIIISQKQPTSYSFIFVSPDGERTVFTSRGALRVFSAFDVLAREINGAQWAYIATGSWPVRILTRLMRVLKRQHILIAISPSAHLLAHGKKAVAPVLAFGDAVIMNRDEATLLTGAEKKTKKIFSELDALVRGIAIMTDGKNGAFVSDGKRVFSGPAFRANIIDETGAGDAFGSGFVAGLAESSALCAKGLCSEDEIVYALRRGAANAASVIEHWGATEGILTKKEFLTQKRWQTYSIKIKHL